MSTALRAAVLAAVGLGLFAWNASHTLECGQPAGCIDPYWADFWLTAYSDGYTRRALLGQLMGLGWSVVPFTTLNAIAGLALVAALVPLVAATFRDRWRANGTPALLVFVVTGPLVMVFFEVLGDPLHVCLALTVGYLAGAARIPRHILLPATVATATLCVAIHEASVYICLPVLYLGYCARASRPVHIGFAAGLVVAVSAVLTVVTNTQDAAPSALGLLQRGGDIHHAKAVLPALSGMLTGELRAMVASPTALWSLVVKFAGSLAFPLCTLLLCAHVCCDREWLRRWLVLTALSLPLYLIAQDWGRFAAYTALLTMAVGGLAPPAIPALDWPDAGVTRIETWAANLRVPVFALVALAFVWPASHEYRVVGARPMTALVLWLGVGLAAATSSRMNRTDRAA